MSGPSDEDIKNLEKKYHNLAPPFKPGQSGNPKGRPKGSKNKLTLLREDAERDLIQGITADMSEVIQTAIKKAKEGDNQMITLLVNKFISNKTTIDEKALTGGSGGITININTTDGGTVIQGEYNEEDGIEGSSSESGEVQR